MPGSRRARRPERSEPPSLATAGDEVSDVERLGLRPGEVVRFRRGEAGRWHDGTAVRVERDGSLGIRDGKGALRAIRLEFVEVKATGPRGGHGWEPLLARARRPSQLPFGPLA